MDTLQSVDGARALYLSILGMALLVALFARYRGRLGEALQHASIWALIFVGAVLAYGFSDELERQLMPSEAVRVEGGAVELRRAPDGHFHARLEVEGTPVEALVDTGATDFVLAPADARRVGLDPERLAYTRRAMTANGMVRGAPVTLERVALGPLVMRDVPAVVTEGRLPTSLLGMSVLDRFASYEVSGDRMRLVP